MKRIWNNPVVNVQQFVPQEYCGACMDAGGLYEHSAHCMNRTNALVFWDTNYDGKISSTENKSVYEPNTGSFHGGCNRTHTWKDNNPTIQYNAVVVLHTGDWTDYVTSNGDGTYSLKSQYLDVASHMAQDSSAGGTHGLVRAFARPWTGSDHYWIVSIDPSSWKNHIS